MNQQTSTGPGTSSVVIEPELKYYRVRTEIETILSGLEEGDAVPSERELAARFTVARETVRQALRDLLVEGRIERLGAGHCRRESEVGSAAIDSFLYRRCSERWASTQS